MKLTILPVGWMAGYQAVARWQCKTRESLDHVCTRVHGLDIMLGFYATELTVLCRCHPGVTLGRPWHTTGAGDDHVGSICWLHPMNN